MTDGRGFDYHQVIIRERFLSLHGGTSNFEQIPSADVAAVTVTKFDKHDYYAEVRFRDGRPDLELTTANVMLQFERLGWIPYSVVLQSHRDV